MIISRRLDLRPVHSPRELPFGPGRIRLPASACGPNAIPTVSPSCEVELPRAVPLRELLRQSAQVLYEVPRESARHSLELYFKPWKRRTHYFPSFSNSTIPIA